MQDPFFFGYGSLVNRATHDYPQAAPARVQGWRRAWRHTATRGLAYLTAIPCEKSEIDGLIAGVPGSDWEARDHRERAYVRVPVTAISHPISPAPGVEIYWVPETKHPAADRILPVLMSYIDVVVQGYLNEFGEQGVREFFATTDGWDVPVHDDRNDPLYPRHQTLNASERRLVDRTLDDYRVGVVTLPLDQRRW